MERAVLVQGIFVHFDCFNSVSSQSHIREAAAVEKSLQELEIDFVVIDKQYSRLGRLAVDTLYVAFAVATNKLIVFLKGFLV